MTTSLDVLNACLRAVGERPVTDYNSNHPTVLAAKQTIEDVSTKFQTRGWWFNKEYSLKLLPVTSGEIIIPTETLEVTPTGAFSHLVRRQGKLYDPSKHSYNIAADVIVHLVIQLPIEDLPASAANYTKELARYTFAVEEEVNEEKINRYATEVLLAKTQLMNEEFKQLDINSGNRPVSAFLKLHTQSYSNARGNTNYIGNEV